MEKQRSSSSSDTEKVDDALPYLEAIEDDGASSTSQFSERHMEGAGSLPDESLSRTTTRTLDRVQTTASSALATIRSRAPRGPFTHPLDREKTKPDVVVEFDGPDDPYRPLNWAPRKKAITVALYGFTTMSNTMSSAIFSPAIDVVAAEFGVNTEVSTLGITLFLLGFGIGPLLWAPLSEVYGRKSAVLPPVLVAICFTFGAGAAKDIQTLMICRFFQGLFGSSPVTNSGGVLADIYTPAQRGAAMVGYTMAIVGGPCLGPIIGSACVMSYLGWRWTQYLTGIIQCIILFFDVLVLDETYAPVLLVRKAQKLRFSSGNWALHARHEEWDVSLRELANKYLIRPFVLLTTPICLLMALYASFTYGILYASLAAIPYEFELIRGWNQVVGSLPFIAQLLGIAIGAGSNLFNQKYYMKRIKANNGKPVPEARLPPMMVGSVIFAAGLFIFAWTSTSKSIPWIAPVIGIALQGIGFILIFQAALNYLIDAFQRYAASAVAANSFLRAVFAGGFPLAMRPLLQAIGIGWGISIFAFFAAALIPIPYVFFVYGKRIRAAGKWSRESTL